MSQKTLKLSLLAASIALAAGQVHSAAFQLAEQNATGLGRAYSGEGAIGDNASVLGRNPAAMTLFDSSAMSVGAVHVNPDIDVEGKGPTAQVGQAAGLPTHSEDIGDSAVVPFFYYVQPLNEQWTAGFGAFTNYGLSTSYQNNHYAGDVAGGTSLETINLNPSIAFKANEHISIGAGFNAVYADAEIIRHTGISSAGIPMSSPTTEAVNLKGDDWGYGWNLGLLLEANDNNRWALTYRSEVDLTLEGDFSSTLRGIKSPGSVDLTLPAIAEASGFHQIQSDWALHYGIMWTEWSSFKELKAVSPQGVELFQKDEGFDNSWRISAGATHQLNDQWTLRGGIAYDQSPVPEDARSISIPDVDRTWYTLGATYTYNQNLSFDAAFAFLDGEKVSVVEESAINPAMDYEFESGGDAYLLGLQMNYAF
ncbi:outer membrane protein transport protein [Oceanisphaera pacifica]|uniref:Outer membrane protein transport protein n=1 Tax=Oceanisphaera pacifica TaxID=2818389 RepID=A0ABS3NIK7_9GAMM|nr:outer membrane protein transport protein [Oceanisphaera pacifica]MBO1520248.1 outer membrane protein transport protein [Oceanisphaera pacifica]